MAKYHFQIQDRQTGRRREFDVMGVGINLGIRGPQGGAVMGSEQTFNFTCPVDDVEDLAGRQMRVTNVGTSMMIDIKSCGVTQKPLPTGPSLGIGVDTVSGEMLMNSDYSPSNPI